MTRPAKLLPSALLVVWGSRVLTMSEKVIFYHDWALDGAGADGSYISCESMSQRLGGEYSAHTIEQIRGRLKRLGLHLPMRRRDARNLGWVSTLPAECIPRSARDAAGLCPVLDAYLTRRVEWLSGRPPDAADTDTPIEEGPTASRRSEHRPHVGPRAAALGGRGGVLPSDDQSEAQLPPAVKKGVGAVAPELQKREERDPALVREEGWALIRLQKGQKLTPRERHLVDEWAKRQPPERRKAVGL